MNIDQLRKTMWSEKLTGRCNDWSRRVGSDCQPPRDMLACAIFYVNVGAVVVRTPALYFNNTISKLDQRYFRGMVIYRAPESERFRLSMMSFHEILHGLVLSLLRVSLRVFLIYVGCQRSFRFWIYGLALADQSSTLFLMHDVSLKLLRPSSQRDACSNRIL